MADGDSVTQRQFFETIDSVKGEIINKINGVTKDIADLSRETGEIKFCVDGQENRIKINEDDIKTLEKSDKRFTAVSTTIATIISTTIAAIMDSFRRG